MILTVLDEGRYYYTSNGIEKAHYCNVNGCVELVTPKGEILSPVPSYEELQRLKHIESKYNNMKVKGNYPDKINELKSRLKHLLDLQENQDKEVEHLRDLLRNCLAHLSLGEIGTSVTPANTLLTSINAAIGESEE